MKKRKYLTLFTVFTLMIQMLNVPVIFAETLSSLPKQTYIVGIKDSVDSEKFANKKGLATKKKFKHIKNINSVVVDLDSEELNTLKYEESIQYIEPDSPIKIVGLENSKDQTKEVNSQVTPWGITDIGANVSQEAMVSGKKVKVAVLDTGVDNHSDLKISKGVSFVDGVNSFIDDNGHGTHVAGTIAAKNNEIGVVGVVPDADIFAIKVLDKDGNGSYSQVIQGIDWAIENGANVISMSIGGLVDNQALHEAVKKAADKGIIVVCAAGNKGPGENTLMYPAAYPEVLSVGAVDKSYHRAGFSSTGSELDMVAPGVDIESTYLDNKYRTLSGTSMATPHVTGAVAAIISKYPDLTVADIKNKLFSSATPLGKTVEYGHGIVNLAKALELKDEPIIVPPVYEQPDSNTEPIKPAFDMVEQDQKFYTLNQRLQELINQAKDAGIISLAKEIETKYNQLLIENLDLHQLPLGIEKISKEEVNLRQQSQAEYFSTLAEDFKKLERQYQESVNKFESQLFTNANVFENNWNNTFSFDGLSDNVGSLSYNFVGDGQTIAPGSSATVSLTLFEPKTAIYINVFNVNTPSSIIASTTLYNKPANTPISYTWNTTTYTPEGTYKIRFTYPNTTTVEDFTIYVKKASISYYPLNLNSPVDVSLGTGAYRVYKFTPLTSGEFKFFTGPYGGYGGSNDTYLELYSDGNLSNRITYNDDSNDTLFSEIKVVLNAGQTYYLKLRPYDISVGAVYARLTAQQLSTVAQIYYNVPIDVDLASGQSRIYKFTAPSNASYKIYTTYYGGNSASGMNDTTLTLYSDAGLNNQTAYNDDTNGRFSLITSSMAANSNYYIKLAGYNGGSVHARIVVTVNPPVSFTTLTNKSYEDISKPATENAYYKFTPTVSGLYRFFTCNYQGVGPENDTYLYLYSDSAMTTRLARNDNSSGPYGPTFSKIEYNLTAGTTYYIMIKHYDGVTPLNTSFAVEDDFDCSRTNAVVKNWDELYTYDLSSRWDVDYYKFALTELEDIRAAIDYNAVTLEDEYGNPLRTFMDGDTETVYTATNTGTYYAKIWYNPATQSVQNVDIVTQGTTGNTAVKKAKIVSPNANLTATPVYKKPIEVRWSYSMAHPTSLQVWKNGKLIYERSLGTISAGTNKATWDGTVFSTTSYKATYNGVNFAVDGQYQLRIVPTDNYAKYYAACFVTVKNTTPTIFVPGITGTELYSKDTVTSTTKKVWTPSGYTDSTEWDQLSQLQLGTDGYTPLNSRYEIFYKEGKAGILQTYLGFNAYQDLVNQLDNAFVPGLTLFYAPYDWRKNLQDESGRPGQFHALKKVIDEAKIKSGAAKVNILSHSMGSLLTKTYLINSNYYGNDVNRWVAAGPPFTGAGKAYLALEYGYDFDMYPIEEKNIQRLALNTPGVYTLLPSQKMVQSDSKHRYIGEVDIDLDGDGVYTAVWDYSKIKSYLSSKFNSQLFTQTEYYHNTLDNNAIPNGIEQIVVVGSGLPTVNRVDASDVLLSSDNWEEISNANGDGTVPVESAIATQNVGARIWYANTSHVGLCSGIFGNLLIDLVLDGQASSDSLGRYRTEYQGGAYAANGLAVTVSQDIQISAVSENAEMVNEAKQDVVGSMYDQIGETKMIFLPTGNGQKYKINLKGIATSSTICVTEYKNGEVVSKAKFKDIKGSGFKKTNGEISSETTHKLLLEGQNQELVIEATRE